MKSLINSTLLSLLLFSCTTTSLNLTNQVESQQTEKARALTYMGDNLAKNSLLTQATEKYLEAIKEDPGFYKAHYSLGRALLKRGFTERGVKSIHRAVEINKNFTQARNFLSSFYFKQGLYKQALKQSIQASKDIVFKNQEQTLTLLGLAYDKLGQEKEALLNMKRALATRPTNCKNRFAISKFFYNKGFVTTSIKVARQADQICGTDKERNSLLYLKALIFYKSENYLASKEILKNISPNQNNLKKAIPKLLTKINAKTGL